MRTIFVAALFAGTVAVQRRQCRRRMRPWLLSSTSWRMRREWLGRCREWLGRGSEHAHSERMPGRGSATTAMPAWLYLAHTIPGLLPELRPSFRALPSAIRLRL